MKLPKTLKPFLIIWLVLNLLQAGFTELIHDESYYWFFSQDLDWGYFDHPPAISFFVYLGGLLFQNELGVRLAIVLLSVASIWLMWKTIEGENLKLFVAIVFSTLIIHVGGFIAVPDIPLVFFVSLYFYFFKKYLNEDSWTVAIWLCIAIVGMAYSKYNGVLVVFFSVLPNLRLFKRPSLWTIALVVLICLVPHLLWQYENDFQTFRYHFIDRSNVPYKYQFISDYLLGQLLIFGPLIGLLLFPAAVRYLSKNDLDRTMKWCFYGIFGFSLFQSFKGRVEPNWTVMAVVPLLYLAYHFIKNHENQKRWVYRLMIPSVLLILIFRVFMVWNFLPEGMVKRNEVHGWDKWAEAIAEEAGDLPVVFQNTFQKTSKYLFYSGKMAHSVNTVDYAGKEYDLKIKTEESLQGQSVFKIHREGKDSFEIDSHKIKYDKVSNFEYFNRIKIHLSEQSYKVEPGSILKLNVIMENPTEKDVDFSKFGPNDLSLEYYLFWYGNIVYCERLTEKFPVEKLNAREQKEFPISISTPPENGEHWQFRIAISTDNLDGRNCNFTHFEMSE